jgi:cell division protein FtsL
MRQNSFTPRILRRHHMSLAEALIASVSLTGSAVLTAAVAITRTDPEQFPHFGVGLWWAAATVTTVGYGDVVPATAEGRLIGAVLMFLGIGSLALLTAICASAIVVGEVRHEEREIQHEESEILYELRGLAQHVERLERSLDAYRSDAARVKDAAPKEGDHGRYR